MEVKDFLKGKEINSYFILDSKQDAVSNGNHCDVNYVKYFYNIHSYNKLEVGSAFLYRQPKKSSKKRKFYIYGGGIIEKIEKVDDKGNVLAFVSDSFKFKEPIYEDDSVFDNIKWTSREKRKGTWEHFWNQYGMNKITEEEFFSIVSKKECIKAMTIDSGIVDLEAIEEEKILVDDDSLNIDISEFKRIETEDSNFYEPKKSKNNGLIRGRHIDYEKLNRKKKTIGTIGELIVLNLETILVDSYNIGKEVEYVADTIGDGLGYDIKSYNEKGKEIHIEVKTTKNNKVDGFYMTPCEIEESKNKEYIYKIYRVYDLNTVKGTFKLEIFEGPITTDNFIVKPISYKINLK